MKLKPILNKNRGITLVELLVVITIIALLVIIAMPNINRARSKAERTAIIAAMSELRAAAELSHNDYDTYDAVCSAGDISDSGDFGRIKANINENGGTDRVCYDSDSAWCAQVNNMPQGGEWCVDYTRYAGDVAYCDAVYFTCAND